MIFTTHIIGLFIRTMSCKNIMQTWTTFIKSLSFRIIHAFNITHKFTHNIPMEIWWSESIFLYRPSVFKNHKIHCSHIGFLWRYWQYCKYRRIYMIIWNWIYNIKFPKIIFIRTIISLPSSYIKWTIIFFLLKKLTLKFVNNNPFFLSVLEISFWILKVFFMSKSIDTNWS